MPGDSLRSLLLAAGSGFRRLRRALTAAAVLLVLYALAGFLLLPWLARPRIERAASDYLQRPVTLQKLRFDPFALSAVGEGLDIRDRDGTPLLHWERLKIDFAAWRSLFKREWWFGEISLDGAAGRLALLPGNALNIDDIVRRLSPPPGAAAKPAGPPPVLGIQRLRIADSSLAFVDRSTATTFTTTLGPIRIDLRDFTTRRGDNNAYTFRGSTESGETFSWSGRFGLDPLGSQGEFSLEKVNLAKYHPYYRGVVPFDIKAGTADLRSAYRVVWAPSQHVLTLAGASLAIHDVALAEHDKDEIAASAPLLEAQQADIDLLAGTASIGKLSTRGGHVLMRKTKDGRVNLLDMVMPFFATPAGSESSVTAAAPPPAAGAPATVRIGEMSFGDYTLDAEDLSPPRPVRVRLDRIELNLLKVDNVPGTTSKGTLSLRWNGVGTLNAAGDVSLVGLHGDLRVTLDGLDVTPVEPYVQPALDLRVTRGTFFAQGRFQADLYDATHNLIDFTGDVRMDDFASVDGRDGADFLAWKHVRMGGLDYSLEHDRIRIAELTIDGARAVLQFAPDGRLNLATVLRLPEAPPESSEGAAAADAAPAATPAAPPTPATPAAGSVPAGDTRIAKARLNNSRIEVIDRTTDPPASLTLNRLEGTLAGLSSRQGARAEVHVRGVAGETAAVALDGQVDPLGADKFSDLVVTARAVDLAPLGPYTVRYLGYALDRGRLDLDMRYRLEERRVKGENVLQGDPFTLGEKVPSPDATHLPVKLGLALLRDRHGVVKLDVPIEGSLDDPKFRLGRVILRAVVDVFAKLVTSPFTLLAHAFAGRDDIDLSVIDFAPGSAEIAAGAQPRLDALVKGLTDRPGLSLAITGRADAGAGTTEPGAANPEPAGENGAPRTAPLIAPPPTGQSADIEALRHAKLEALLRDAKWQSLRRSARDATPVATVTVDPGDRPRYLKAAWKTFTEAHPDAANPKPQTPEETEARLFARVEVGAADLQALAEARARAVRDHLAQAGIEASRLTVKAEPQGGQKVTLELQ